MRIASTQNACSRHNWTLFFLTASAFDFAEVASRAVFVAMEEIPMGAVFAFFAAAEKTFWYSLAMAFGWDAGLFV